MAETINTTRRSLAGGIAAMAALAVTAFGARSASVPTDEEIEKITEQLAVAMRARHGGSWRWAVMHDTQVVMVLRDFPSCPSTAQS